MNKPSLFTDIINNKTRTIYLWLIFSSLYILLFYYLNTFVISSSIYYNSFAEKLSVDRINQLINKQKEYLWISYLFIPIFLFIRIRLTSGCIFARLFFSHDNIRFKEILKIVYWSEIIFVLSGIFRSIILAFFIKPTTLKELQAFSPLSLISIMNINKIPLYLFYPLQVINLFEIAYWIFLSLGLKELLHITLSKAFLYVLTGYGLGLFLWVLCVVFIQLQFS
jgi:hypothetical protein